MAVALTIRSAGLTTTRYDEVMVRLELDAVPSVGQILHVAVETPEGVVIQEVWQTAAAALHHLEHRLTPAMQGVGAGEPEADVVPLHNLYAADFDVIERIGGVSLPAHAAGAALY
jgi:hypothetical protein